MGNEPAIRNQPVPDWFTGPGQGCHPAMLGPEERELRDLGDAVHQPVPAPEVQFGQKAERINPTSRELDFIVPLTDGPSYLGDITLAVAPDDVLSGVAQRLPD